MTKSSEQRRPIVHATDLLLTAPDVQDALGAAVVGITEVKGAPPAAGTLLSVAADSAYRRFTGTLLGDGDEEPVAVSSLVLIFDAPEQAKRTFDQVAQAAHLRTTVGEAEVAVETVTGAAGLVSYWGFVYRERAIVILALDTVDPQRISVSELRSLVAVTERRLSANSDVESNG